MRPTDKRPSNSLWNRFTTSTKKTEADKKGKLGQRAVNASTAKAPVASERSAKAPYTPVKSRKLSQLQPDIYDPRMELVNATVSCQAKHKAAMVTALGKLSDNIDEHSHPLDAGESDAFANLKTHMSNMDRFEGSQPAYVATGFHMMANRLGDEALLGVRATFESWQMLVWNIPDPLRAVCQHEAASRSQP